MKRIRIFNRQRTMCLQGSLLRQMAQCLLEELLDRHQYELGIHIINAEEMARLNETFLGHEGSTDVITFDHKENATEETICGEIFISIDDALVHARRFRVRWPQEVTRYLVHGVLHLEGYDDKDSVSRRAMKREENKLLKELSARFALTRLGKAWP
jgi:probable rRNA maturation factor